MYANKVACAHPGHITVRDAPLIIHLLNDSELSIYITISPFGGLKFQESTIEAGSTSPVSGDSRTPN